MKNLRNYFKQLDYVLIAICSALALLGLLMIISATKSEEGSRQVLVQSLAIGLGALGMFVMAAIDYEDYTELVKFLYILPYYLILFLLLN